MLTTTTEGIGLRMPQITNQQAVEEKNEQSRVSAFVGAIAISDLVKTTLGPKGMDKILQPMSDEGGNNKIVITNDGAKILNSVYVDNGAAKVLVDCSKCQDSAVGDGTTSVCVLAGELLREADKLIEKKIHPQFVISGYRQARDKAMETLNSLAMDNHSNPEAYRQDLINIAMTTLSSKLVTHEKRFFAEMVVDAVERLGDNPSLDLIKIIKKPGATLRDSFLDEGFILEKNIAISCPKVKENPKILIANTPMDYDKIKIYGSRVKVGSIESVAQIEQAEKEKMKNKVEKILSHGCDVFINRQLIYDYPEQLMADKGVMVIEHAEFDGIERLAAVTGGEILSTFDNPEKAKLGTCGKIEEIMIGEDKVIKFSGCKNSKACSIVLRGASAHLLDEAERSIHDALCVICETVKSHRCVYGGGFCETKMAIEVEKLANEKKGKESIAISSFAKALMQIPTIIADNAGLDSSELTSNLRSEVYNGSKEAGLDVYNGCIASMKEKGVYECFRVKEQAIISACEAAEMIIRVDMTFTAPPRQRTPEESRPC
ncbi:MAG: T-complex protein 1 subunit beta [archaeon]|nr:T-complex protein 1 subunit beta [archaeon]